ncbi:MAG: UbiA family prenyltransferase [Bacteroidetes bacterium]|nr:UbiA family prenyltransferase [Bacteroidota bacterium]
MNPKSSGTVANYLSLIKFSHTVFALPFALIGFLLGLKYNGFDFSTALAIKVLLCMVFARNAAMAFNRWTDRNIDAANPRTINREIPSGIISEKSALMFAIINALLFIATTFFINKLCFLLSPIALLVVLGYSYTKRFTALCHLVLGVGLSLAPIGAFLAVTGKFEWEPLLYSFAVLFWVSGFDIIYSLQDDAFDRMNQLKSLPSVLGRKNALILSRFFHVLTLLFLLAAINHKSFGNWGYIGLLLFSMLLIYQHFLVKEDDLSKVNIAFFTTNGIASVVFALCLTAGMFIR